MNKSQIPTTQIPDYVSGKNCIVVDVELKYNEFFDRLDTEYECAVHLVNEDALSPHTHMSCIHKFLGSFCDIFADATQNTDMVLFNELLTSAANLGFYVVYPELVDKAMCMDAKIKLDNAEKDLEDYLVAKEQ